MRKITAVMMAMVLAASLAGCAQGKAEKETTKAAETVAATEAQTEAQAEKESSGDSAVAQPAGYPSKTIDFVVPAAPGAMLDLLVRGLDESGLDLGTPLAISNMAGASQTLGLAEVASRKADGYTLTCSGAAGTLIQPLLLDLTYQMEDFRYISMLNAAIPNSVAVSANSEYQTWEDLQKKLQAGEIVHYTSANTGSVGHMAALELINQVGAPGASYVSYNGSAEAMTALLSGDVDFMIYDVDVVMEREEEGQLRCLLTLADERNGIAPEVPSAKEVGIEGMDSFVGMTWIMISADTPDEIVTWVKQQLDAAVGSEEFKEFLRGINKEPTPVVSEEELTTMLYEARDAYKEVIAKMEQQ